MDKFMCVKQYGKCHEQCLLYVCKFYDGDFYSQAHLILYGGFKARHICILSSRLLPCLKLNALGYIKSRACVLPARRAPRQITAARAGGAPLRDTHSANPFHLRATNRVQYSAYRLGKALASQIREKRVLCPLLPRFEHGDSTPGSQSAPPIVQADKCPIHSTCPCPPPPPSQGAHPRDRKSPAGLQVRSGKSQRREPCHDHNPSLPPRGARAPGRQASARGFGLENAPLIAQSPLLTPG